MEPKLRKRDRILGHPLLRKYLPLVHEDLTVVYSRNLQKWLLLAPVIGIVTGLLTTGLVVVILRHIWPAVLGYDLHHHWAIIPSILFGFVAAGLIMQFLTPDPDDHSTEEVIRSYHEHQGSIDMRAFVPKLLASIATVGFGGSAALEGPGIYGGAGIGSWLWTKVRRLGFDHRDRRIMLICGAAAGMSAVFRAPLTGIVFALEMPYRDDLAHEALVPSLIASVVSFITMGAFLGTSPLFNFLAGRSYTRIDLYWSALLGLVIGLVATVFVITFRHARRFFVTLEIPHWTKMAIGGLLTGICGVVFLWLYPGALVPIGPNYEAVGYILTRHYPSSQLLAFSGLKLVATIATLASGGVSAMFVPLFLTGGALGSAFAQSIVHSPALGLYAAVGMASFISAGYKTPLAAVVFVAEATGGHAFIIPALIGAAVAYAVSGDASASGDQRLHEGVKVQELRHIPVSDVMQEQMVFADGDLTVQQFVGTHWPHSSQDAFPVIVNGSVIGALTAWRLTQVPPEQWQTTHLRDIHDGRVRQVERDCDVTEALRLLMSESSPSIVLVVSDDDSVCGVVTATDILSVLKND